MAHERHPDHDRANELTTSGVTLLGVLLSIGVTVGIGISGQWWLRVSVGAAATLALVVVVKLATRSGRGPLARLAQWTISGSNRDGAPG